MLTRRAFAVSALVATMLVAGLSAWAGAKMTFNVGGIAINGYDPVAYFTKGEPVPGSDDHALMWAGATWYFASAENMAKFEANPRAYAPQYGGYCAYAMAQGALAPSAPEAFTIHDGKLYLNISQSIRETWLKDIPGNVTAANANWPNLKGH